MDIVKLIEEFLILQKNNNFESIYNEFSLQHELGIFLRGKLPKEYKVEFERNINFFLEKTICEDLIKKEMDIVIYDKEKKKKICIELKHPLRGQYPEQMFSFLKDIKFLEELTENNFDQCISLVLVKDHLFYEGKTCEGIYKFFRNNEIITGNIKRPTGQKNEVITFNKKYKIDWINLDKDYFYYIVDLKKYKGE